MVPLVFETGLSFSLFQVWLDTLGLRCMKSYMTGIIAQFSPFGEVKKTASPEF